MSGSDEKLTLEGLNFTTLRLNLQNHIFTITLNRPERKNAINPTMSNELIYAFDYARQSRDVRVVVIAAEGDIFCAGGDLRTMSGEESANISNVPKRGETDEISLRLRHLSKPVIAKIQGPVLAGALLLVCNTTHAFAADDAYFSAPEIKRGIWPFMVMAGLFRVMSKRDGLDFIMRGHSLTAKEAEKTGLINQAVARDMLDETVDDLATELASLAPGTMQLGLAAYNRQEDLEFDQALPYLRQQLDHCLKSDDAKEGISAFLEKRQPEWR
ncbi:enoyl-CoA hydratase/isomerase family protein [Sneathiella glossodoripedis]|uniref:enoyl-CoA hydratase/isomerase family protein n=1 Tax=Sneathiella glossodoripedis TaxID=418853 RepID=UPI00046FF87C|nr:enoyl-CoA hydratase/isomerase family protein [Sneathiella glossodoripedis]